MLPFLHNALRVRPVVHQNDLHPRRIKLYLPVILLQRLSPVKKHKIFRFYLLAVPLHNHSSLCHFRISRHLTAKRCSGRFSTHLKNYRGPAVRRFFSFNKSDLIIRFITVPSKKADKHHRGNAYSHKCCFDMMFHAVYPSPPSSSS